MRWSNFPYVVEIAGPIRGVRKLVMYDFHVRLDIEAHPLHEHSGHQRDSRWHFASLTKPIGLSLPNHKLASEFLSVRSPLY
jgi:hypothetical protein